MFLHADFFVPQGVYIVLIIRKIRILWGKKERSCLWGLARFVLELPTGPLPPPHPHPASARQHEAVGEASPPLSCISVLEGSRLYAVIELPPHRSESIVNPSKTTVISHFLTFHSVLIPFWLGLCLSSLLKWMLICLLTCLSQHS